MSVATIPAAANDLPITDRTATALSSMLCLSFRCRKCERMLYFRATQKDGKFIAEVMHKPDCDPPKNFWGRVCRGSAIFFLGFR